MLVKLKFQLPEFALGVLLTATIFAMGMAFESSPIFAQTAQQIGTQSTKAESPAPPQPHDESRWAWITKDAAGFFTLCLVLVGSGQIILFWVQLRLIRESLDDAKEVASASTRQAKVAEDSLAKLERPYLFIFNVGRLEVEQMTWDQDSGGDDLLLSVTYSVANYGKIPAIIKHALAGLSVAVDPTSPDRLPYSHTLVVSPIFAAGETRHGIAERLVWDRAYGNDEDGNIVPTLGKDNTLFFWIIITYRGPFTDGHETRVCWQYDKSTGRFIGPYGGPEYSGEK
jgi:hypothetical protein